MVMASGQEIMQATLNILERLAGAHSKYDVIEIVLWARFMPKGISSGMEPKSFDSLRELKVFLKSPSLTPQGARIKSLNVDTRKSFGLFATCVRVKSIRAFVRTHFPKTDLVIIRENEEDLYAGIWTRPNPGSLSNFKLISEPGFLKNHSICIWGNAKKTAERKWPCNDTRITYEIRRWSFSTIKIWWDSLRIILKLTMITKLLISERLWVAKSDRKIFWMVIVTPYLYGDIISDVAAQVTGSVGLGWISKCWRRSAMFESPISMGSLLNISWEWGMPQTPSGLFEWCNYDVGPYKACQKWQRKSPLPGWELWKMEIHTGDIYQEGLSTKKGGNSGIRSTYRTIRTKAY